jgi:glycine oxidase ThiO
MARSGTSDVVVIGGGVVGLACAIALARRGVDVALLGRRLPGEASPAAGGILCPSIEQSNGPAHEFGVAARDRYPTYLDELADLSGGVRVPLNREGVLQIALSTAGVRGLRLQIPPESRWIDAPELTELEPALSHGLGAVLHPFDGVVDNRVLLDAMHATVIRLRIEIHDDVASDISLSDREVRIATSVSGVLRAERVILAAGAWVPLIHGVSPRLPIEPVRGQMLAFPAVPTRRVVFGPTGYILPRHNGICVAGSTTEHVGFDAGTTEAGAERIAASAREIAPSLASVGWTGHWSGLRPITPDLLPIIGPHPDEPRIVYACGHSRNGVLMAPLTGDCIAALAAREEPPIAIGPFAIERFE